MHNHVGYIYIYPLTIPPIATSASSIALSISHNSLMQFNSNGFYWLGDSSECTSSVQLHKGVLWVFTRQSTTSSPQSHACTCTGPSNKKNLIYASQWRLGDETTNRGHILSHRTVCELLCHLFWTIFTFMSLVTFSELPKVNFILTGKQIGAKAISASL